MRQSKYILVFYSGWFSRSEDLVFIERVSQDGVKIAGVTVGHWLVSEDQSNQTAYNLRHSNTWNDVNEPELGNWRKQPRTVGQPIKTGFTSANERGPYGGQWEWGALLNVKAIDVNARGGQSARKRTPKLWQGKIWTLKYNIIPPLNNNWYF